MVSLSQRLLVAQSVVADESQPNLAPFKGRRGVAVPNPGVAAISTKKLGVYTLTHHVRWNVGVLVGEVTIEVADDVSYDGSWAAVGVVTFEGTAPKQDAVVLNNHYGAVRHRITQPVVGGSVTTKVVAAG